MVKFLTVYEGVMHPQGGFNIHNEPKPKSEYNEMQKNNPEFLNLFF